MLRIASLALLAFVTGCSLSGSDEAAPLTPAPWSGGERASEPTSSTSRGTPVAEASAPPPSSIVASPVTPNGPAAPSARCDVTRPFARPELVSSVSATDVDDAYPVLSADELQIWFTRLESNTWSGARTFTASRKSTAEAFGPATALTVVQGAYRLSILGSLTFADIRDESAKGGRRHIRGQSMPSLDPTIEQAEPYLANESAVYFTTFTEGAWQLQRITRDAGSVQTVVLPMAGMHQVWPVVSPDEKQVWFGAERTDGGDTWDVMTATRPSNDVPFGEPTLVHELSGPTMDLPSWISSDGCTMALSSNRANDTLDIYIAHRAP